MARFGRALVVPLTAMLVVLVVPGAASARKAPQSYVSLGDSYTAGPIIPVQQNDPLGCLRSDHNYPHLVAAALGVSNFHDPSCSGAETGDMTSAQGVSPGPNPPQFDSLSATTELVTLGIGGNDIGFTEITQNCFSTTPTGHPCQDHYVVNGHDELSDRIDQTAPKVAAVLQGIHQRAPKAQIYVVPYLAILPESSLEEELRTGTLRAIDAPALTTTIPVALIRRRTAFQTGAAQALAAALTDWPHKPGTYTCQQPHPGPPSRA